jgi:hypothetical protein
MATVLIARAAAIATRVRLIGDCDDIDILPFSAPIAGLADARCYSSAVPIPQISQKPARQGAEGDFTNQDLVGIPNRHLGTFATPGASNGETIHQGVSAMLGKLAGAWLGSKMVGRNSGVKGAALGYGAAALARRSVPALAAVTIGGWAFRKFRERRAARAAYPSEATPSSL